MSRAVKTVKIITFENKSVSGIFITALFRVLCNFVSACRRPHLLTSRCFLNFYGEVFPKNYFIFSIKIFTSILVKSLT